MKPIHFEHDDFSATFSAFDKEHALRPLARVILGVMSTDVPDKTAKREAIRLAEKYLPIFRSETK
jgi:hypothetical protein